MTAHTATDAANLITGSDFVTIGTLANGRELVGYLTRGDGGALMVNDNKLRFTLTRSDAVNYLSVGDTISIGRDKPTAINTYTVREIEPGDYLHRLVLELGSGS